MRGHGRGFGRGRGHAQGGHSLLVARMLEPALLVILAGGDFHGYTLLDRLEQLGFGALHASMVYRVLRELEDAGWVSSTWDHEQTQGPPRRVYTLNPQGSQALGEWKNQLEHTRQLITDLIEKIPAQNLD
jgi:PadR family transcriptional regulator, regulatory protein PadR